MAEGSVEPLMRKWETRRKKPPKRFRELVRAIDDVAKQPGALDIFRRHIRDVAERRAKGTCEENAVEEELSSPREPGEPLTLAGKYAYLASVHDMFGKVGRFEKIHPPEWSCDLLAGPSASGTEYAAWHAYVGLARDFDDERIVPEDSQDIDRLWGYLNEVKADLGGATGKAKGNRKRKRRRRKTPQKPRPLTEKQTEAILIVAECKGNLAEAAWRLGIDRSSLKERYEAACKKLGRRAVKAMTKSIPVDRRGQEDVAGSDDGPGSLRKNPHVRRDQRGG